MFKTLLVCAVLFLGACDEEVAVETGDRATACALSTGSLAECYAYTACEHRATCDGSVATTSCVDEQLLAFCDANDCTTPVDVSVDSVRACLEDMEVQECGQKPPESCRGW